MSTADRKKGRAWLFFIGAGSCIALFVLFLLFLPLILNLDSVKATILSLASEQLGARLDYEKTKLSLFPRPSIVIQQGSLLRPGEIEISLKQLTADTTLLPLLQGNLELARVRIEAPALRLELSEEGGETSDISVQEKVRKEVASVVSALTSKTPGLAVQVEEGTLELCREDRPVFRIEDLAARIESRPDHVWVDLSCRSRLWEGLSVTGSIGDTLKGKSQIRLSGFQRAPLLEAIHSWTDDHEVSPV